MDDLFLTEKEVASLTRKVRRSAQVRALRAMGIEHRCRPDGSVAVLRAHIERVFDAPSRTRTPTAPQPHWDAI